MAQAGPTAEKAAARAAAFARRAAAQGALGPAPEGATAALLGALAGDPAEVVAGYLPIRTEIDPRPAMAALIAQGRRVCVPMVLGRGRALGFLEWRPGEALAAGPFGVTLPEMRRPCVPEALIVPLAAFDADGVRLGYGGGFYDRTLAALRGARAVGFAYGAQRAEGPLPREATDVPLAAVATEAGVFRPAPRGPEAAPARGARPA